MIKVKIIATGEIKEVTPNIAHGMMERGEAEVLSHSKSETKRLSYSTREMASTGGTTEPKTSTKKKRGRYRTK